MLRAFRAFDGARAETVKPWLLAIVRNCFREHARRGRRLEPLGEQAEGLACDAPGSGGARRLGQPSGGGWTRCSPGCRRIFARW